MEKDYNLAYILLGKCKIVARRLSNLKNNFGTSLFISGEATEEDNG
jgi:uncharacterized protein with ATP-grasp and redox domains